MTVISPPNFMSVDGVYQGRHLGIPYRDILTEGVVGTNDLKVSQRGAGANLSVDVAAGVVWVAGDDAAATQPLYRCYNDGTVNLAIATADATNPRVDRVVAEVRDSAFAGVSQDWRLRVVTGTPAGSPSAPSIPVNCVSLATVSVPALDTTISDAQITDTRPYARNRVGGVPSCRVYKSSAQSIPHNSFTSITFDAERHDHGGLHSTASNTSRITFTEPGVYLFGISLYWALNTTGIRTVRAMVNGVTALGYEERPAGTGTGQGQNLVGAYLFAANDYLEFQVYQTSGGNLNVESGGNYSPEAWAVMVGGANLGLG